MEPNVWRRVDRTVLFVSLTIWLTGCATAAQQQAKLISEAGTAALEASKECNGKTSNQLRYDRIARFVPIRSSGPNLEQLSNRDLPNAVETRDLVSWHRDVQHCRTQLLEALQKDVPAMAPVFSERYTDLDSVLAQLVQGRLTWGDANQKMVQINKEGQRRIAEVGQRMDVQLRAEHQVEIARRQAIGAALSAAAVQMQQSVQQQRLINALNSPTSTTCDRFGNSVHCHSF